MRTFLAKGPYLEALENRSENITLEEAAGNVPLNVAKTFVPNIDAIRVDCWANPLYYRLVSATLDADLRGDGVG